MDTHVKKKAGAMESLYSVSWFLVSVYLLCAAVLIMPAPFAE